LKAIAHLIANSAASEIRACSRTHDGLMDVLQIGRNDAEGYFYYVMELADDGSESGLEGARG
jgi:hypothetical protein